MEDLIPDEDLVVTITRGGYAKRTLASNYRTQRRGGKGVRGAALRGDDVVEHFMATSNHHWLLFFTTAGRVYRTKAYNLPEASRDAKGGHVAGLLSFQPDEQIAQVLAIRDYDQAPYLVLATRAGLVKKTRLADYNSPRQAGVIAINFREEDDELIGAELVNADDDILLVSRKGQAIRFTADDSQLRPMGRATSGVQGMKFRDGDALLSMSVIRAEQVRRSRSARGRGEAAVRLHHHRRRLRQAHPISDYRTQSRGGLGIKAMSLANEDRGVLVGAFIVVEGDEILSITSGGQVVRSPIDEQFRATGRSTMGVRFVTPKNGDSVAVVARSVEKDAAVEEAVEEAVEARPPRPGRRKMQKRLRRPRSNRTPDDAVQQSTPTADGPATTRGGLMADRNDSPIAPRRSLSGPDPAAAASRAGRRGPQGEEAKAEAEREKEEKQAPRRQPGEEGRAEAAKPQARRPRRRRSRKRRGCPGEARKQRQAQPAGGREGAEAEQQTGQRSAQGADRGRRRSRTGQAGAALCPPAALDRPHPVRSPAKMAAAPPYPPGAAATGPDRRLVGDEDLVPALDRARHRAGGGRRHHLVGARRRRRLGLDQLDRPAGRGQ